MRKQHFLDKVLEGGKKFNEEISESMKDLIARQKILKAKFMRQSKSAHSHLTHDVEDYLKHVESLDLEALTKLLG